MLRHFRRTLRCDTSERLRHISLHPGETGKNFLNPLSLYIYLVYIRYIYLALQCDIKIFIMKLLEYMCDFRVH